MSHVTEVKTKIRDIEALKSACRKLNYNFKEGQKHYKWYGTWMGDSPMPEGMTQADLGKCDHAISVPGADYEVGVAKTADGFQLRYDYWGSGGLHTALGGQKAEKLVQAYSVEKTRREAKRMGFRVARELVQVDGSVKLILQGN